MDEDQSAQAREVADRVVELAEELETHADVTMGGEALDSAREVLHRWVDGARGVVVNPALGRVTVIDGQGNPCTITSPTLPFQMSRPLGEG